MFRSESRAFGSAVAFLVLAGGTCVAQPSATRHLVNRQTMALPRVGDGMPSWMHELFEGRRRSSSRNTELTLQAPAPTSELVIPLTVSTSLAGVHGFELDVDLNHDGIFEGRGELSYTTGRFDRNGTGTVRLHGLIHGRYQARVRVRQGSREVVSAAKVVEVLPPPSNRLPVSFEPNVGQADEAVLFLGRARNQLVFITVDETVFVTPNGKTPSVQRFRLLGANSWVRPIGEKKLPGISNYFIGNDPSKWRTDIETYLEVLTRDVYTGIDLVYHSSQGQLEYDFRVAAGADPSAITLDFPDVDRLSIDADGVLILHLPDGQQLRKSAPVMLQCVDEGKLGNDGLVLHQACLRFGFEKLRKLRSCQ